MVGAGHPTLSDTLNRLSQIEHNTDGTHKNLGPNTFFIGKFTGIADALTQIGSTEATLIVNADTLVSGATTIPPTLSVVVTKGGKFTKSGSGALTINGSFEAGQYQVFSGFSAGEVAVSLSSAKEVLDIWFGNDIQVAINATPTKGTLRFVKDSYSLGSITLKADVAYEGSTDREFNTTHSILKYNAVTGDFLTLYNAGATQPGITLKNLIIDGNATTGTLVKLGTHRSKIIDSVIKNGGTGSKGIHFTSGGVDTAVENGVWRTHIKGVGTGIYSDGSATDGFIRDSLIYSCTGNGIDLQQAAGWLVDGNHLYTVTGEAIVANGGYYTILGNYIEGNQTAGIHATLNTSFASAVISGNRINTKQNSSKGIRLDATTTSRVQCALNVLYATNSPTGTTGISVEGSNTIYGELSNNIVENYTTKISSTWTDNTDTLYVLTNKLNTSADRIRLRANSGGNIDFMTGSGAPEGVVTANPGSLYTDYSAGALYLKQSGAGNTGWALK
jgi:hypothetical protein